MARPRRRKISQETGSYHITSRAVGGQFLFKKDDKELFLKLLKRLVAGFFVRIHSICILDNHFHLLVTMLEKEARKASKNELLKRYSLAYPQAPGPPKGTYDSNGELIKADEDAGIERLRKRFGDISRFAQELKQGFSRSYNKKHRRKGCLWESRFTSIIVEKGEAQLNCSTYIDLNPVRANIVSRPESYRWSSLGLRVQQPDLVGDFLFPLSILPGGKTGPANDFVVDEQGQKRPVESSDYLVPKILPIPEFPGDDYELYRAFVYMSGGVKREGSCSIRPELIDELVRYNRRLGVYNLFRSRVKNFSKGLAVGGYDLVSLIQKDLKRKHIRPRSFMGRDQRCHWSFSTRVLRL